MNTPNLTNIYAKKVKDKLNQLDEAQLKIVMMAFLDGLSIDDAIILAKIYGRDRNLPLVKPSDIEKIKEFFADDTIELLGLKRN